ncbi:hypothetical protein GQ44DRAFT_739527 [Phaeosphaeriaceae sp. PMI808]|nr:hypothetical protein GQ44DRAFT_739527 [Phaeosphaeriaceae sp. PMI808]
MVFEYKSGMRLNRRPIKQPTSTPKQPPLTSHITIIERRPSPRPGGQAIDIRTMGVTIMRNIPGPEAAVRAKHTCEEGVCFVRGDGSRYGTLGATGSAERQGLVSEYEILRGDLAGIIYNFTRGRERQDGADGRVRVEFANGERAAEYDWVIGCDGATSRTRGMGFGCGWREHVVPTNSWAAYFSIKWNFLGGSRVGHGYSAPGGRFMSVGADPVTGGNRVVLIGAQPRDQRDRTLEYQDALKKYIAETYRDIGWKSEEIIQEMMESTYFYSSEIVQVKMPKLYNGRFVLVGDAGYAAGLTGGGTSLALAGAYMLVGEIGKHKGDLSAGLKSYEQIMKPLIKEMQKIPPFVPAVLAPQTAWRIWLRNQIFAFVAWTGIAEFATKYLGAAFADANMYLLPEYDWDP